MRCRRLRPPRTTTTKDRRVPDKPCPKSDNRGKQREKHPSVNRRGNSGYHRGDSGGQHHEKRQSRTSTIRHKREESRQHARSQKSPCAHRHDREARRQPQRNHAFGAAGVGHEAKRTRYQQYQAKRPTARQKLVGHSQALPQPQNRTRAPLPCKPRTRTRAVAPYVGAFQNAQDDARARPGSPEKQVGYGKFAEQSSPPPSDAAPTFCESSCASVASQSLYRKLLR